MAATREILTNTVGEEVAELAWMPYARGMEAADVDNGRIERRPGAVEVTVVLQNRATGTVTRCAMPDAVTAFYALGLSTERCNGVDEWAGWTSELRGAAGLD